MGRPIHRRVSPERPSLIRRFAQLGQRLKGKGQDDIDLTDRPAWKSGSSPSSTLSTAFSVEPSVCEPDRVGIESKFRFDGSGRARPFKDEAAGGRGRRPGRAHGHSGLGIRVRIHGSGHDGNRDADARGRRPPPRSGHHARTGCTGRRPRQLSARSPAYVNTEAEAARDARRRGTGPDRPYARAGCEHDELPRLRPVAHRPGTRRRSRPSAPDSNWSRRPDSRSSLRETCAQPAGKKCNLLEKLCPLKKHRPLPSSQCVATAQTCESTVVKVKKPCFLKTFLHNKTCPGKGCGCAGDGCDAHALTASPLAGLPSPQY